MLPVERDEYAQAVTAALTKLSAAAFAAAWAERRSLTPEQVLAAAEQEALARPMDEPPTQTPEALGLPEGLTPREVEVLRWLSEGLTNQEIAERLVVSPTTIRARLRSIYSKLGVTTRSAATRYARDHQLV